MLRTIDRNYFVRLCPDPTKHPNEHSAPWTVVRADGLAEAARGWTYHNEGAPFRRGDAPFVVEVRAHDFPHEVYRYRFRRTAWEVRVLSDDEGVGAVNDYTPQSSTVSE